MTMESIFKGEVQSKYLGIKLYLYLFYGILMVFSILMIPAEVWYCTHQGKFDRQTTDKQA